MMKEMRKKNNIVTNLGMTSVTIGDHGLTYNIIFDLVLGLFDNRFVIKQKNINASRLLYLSKGIKVHQDIFTAIKLGDINVLIYENNLGKDYSMYTHDFAIVNNIPTLFLFPYEITSDKYMSRTLKTYAIYELFSDLVQLFKVQEYYNLTGSIYSTIIEYAPMVMTVRLIEYINYPNLFSINKDYNEEYFYDNINSWFGQDALDIIHNYTDKELLEFGAGLVEFIQSNQ